jgi:hypothetical protein
LKNNSFGAESNNSGLNDDYWDKLVHELLFQGAIFLGAGLGLSFMLHVLRKGQQ